MDDISFVLFCDGCGQHLLGRIDQLARNRAKIIVDPCVKCTRDGLELSRIGLAVEEGLKPYGLKVVKTP